MFISSSYRDLEVKASHLDRIVANYLPGRLSGMFREVNDLEGSLVISVKARRCGGVLVVQPPKHPHIYP
jgi:hypothetical protein